MPSPESPPDPQLLLQHAGFIRGIARGLLLDAQSADDVVQETWLAALRRPPRKGANLRAWLAVVARNMASRLRRSARRRAVHEGRGGKPDRLPSAAELAARLEVQRRVLDAVERLDEPFRATLLYRYFDGLMPKEIAERLGVPVKTVKSRLHRALHTLRADLGRAYGGDDTKWSALLLPLAWPAHVGSAGGGLAAAGGIALTMKKWTIAFALLLCLLGTTVVVWEKTGDAQPPPKRADAARAPEPLAPAVEEAAPARVAVATSQAVLHEGDAVPAFTFAGRVVDAEGRGLGGAELRLVYWTAGKGETEDTDDKLIRLAKEQRERPATLADPDGYFRLDRPYASKSHLVASAQGFTPAATEVKEPGVFLRITLAKGPMLRVTAVREPGGAPVADATVRLVTTPLGRTRRVALAETTTDASGVAELPASQAADLWIEVDPKEPNLAAVGSRVAAAQDAVLVKVPSQASQAVRITDGRTGEPVPSACVFTCRGAGRNASERRRFPADADGRVLVPWGIDELRFATAPGYEITIASPETKLWPVMRIEGKVVDEDGRPVEDAAILVAHPPGMLFTPAFSGASAVDAWSDANGNFAVDDSTIRQGRLPDDGVRSVVAIHPAHTPAISDPVAVEPGGRAVVELRFPPASALELEIVDPAGAPLKFQWVLVQRRVPLASGKLDERDGGINMVALVHGQHSLATDEHGWCEAKGLPPGRYSIRSQESKAEVDLLPGVTTRIRLVKGAGLKIAGRVVRADGTPAAGVWLGVPGAPALGGKQTDADGRFEFTDVPDVRLANLPVDHKVQVAMPDWNGRLDVPVRIGEDALITLPAGPAKLRIQTNLAQDVQLFYALATKTGGRAPAEKWASGFGALETEAFTPGSGLLVVMARGYGTAEVDFDAAAARTTAVDVWFPPPGSVQGAVGAREGVIRFVRLTPTAAAPRGNEALRRQLSDALQASQLTAGIGADGAFKIAAVPPGPYRATLFEANHEVATREIEVRSSEALTISFESN